MSVDDIRIQKGLALLEQREAALEVDSRKKDLVRVSGELKMLAGFLEQHESDSVAGLLPADWQSLSLSAFALFEQLQKASTRLEAANVKLRQFGLS